MTEQGNRNENAGTGGPPGPPPPGARQPQTSVADRPQVTGPAGVAGSAVPPRTATFPPKRLDAPTTGSSELVGVLIAGFLGNLVLRTGVVASAAMVGLVLILAVVVVANGRIRRGEPLAFLLLALAVAPWLVIRADNALTAMNVVIVLILLSSASGLSFRGSAFDSKVRDLVSHVCSPVYEWIYGLGLIGRFVSLTTAEHKFAPFLRGAIVAVPVLIVFTTLLASADDVFANFLLLDDLPTVVSHVFLTVVVSILLFGFVSRAAHVTPTPSNPRNIRVLGPVEVTMILGSLATLFAAFVATQVVVAAGGAQHVLETEGLTQSEHARDGFFQLLWVAGLAAALVGGLRAVRIVEPEKGRDRFTPLALVTLALTLVIAYVSSRRLGLYVESFGLTPLRFWALAGTAGIALLIVTYGVSISGWRSDTDWFPGVAIVVAAMFTLGLNVVNPDVRVAEYNMGRSAAVDVDTLASLSDDAIETMLGAIGTLAPLDGEQLGEQLCRRPDRQASFGVFEYNAARVGADDVLDAYCTDRVTAEGTRSGD